MSIDFQCLTGSRSQLEEKYHDLYGEGNYEEKIISHRRKVMRRYLLVGILFAFTIVYSIASGDSGPTVENRDGRMISVKRPETGEDPIILDARVQATSENIQVTQEKRIFIAPQNTLKDEEGVLKEEPEGARLERKISAAARSLNQDTGSSAVILPTMLEDGTELQWQKVEKSSSPILFFVLMAVVLLIHHSRYDTISREEKAARTSVVRELPEFINKLVLLLNGGIVMEAAMERIIEDEEKNQKGRETYFYEQLRIIHQKSKETNAPMHIEFYRFARRSKVQELMRIAGILTDNVSKGSDLAVKLQRESEMLWFARKKQSEEKGRLAETKMTLPLVILLLVLVMITIAPALMEM